MKTVPISEFLELAEKLPVVDVRSPGEFEKGHISNGYNIPVFKDDERAIVGTIYKQQGKKDAIEKGLEIVGPKMLALAKEAERIAVEGQLLVHCWRGGMRSNRMAWLFEQVGLQCAVLEGGYKAYRNHILGQLTSVKNLVMLSGPTGSGKTAVLHEMKKLGAQIIDLEGMANHRGSAFGAIGQDEQPPGQQFQNEVFHSLAQLDQNRPVWVESESLTIGKVYLPQPFWESMNEAPSLVLNVPQEIRVKRLVEEYGTLPKEELAEAIKKIQQNFGGNRVKSSLEALEQGNFEFVAEQLLDYYDKRYDFGRKKNRIGSRFQVESETGDPKENAKLVLEHWNERERKAEVN